MSLSKNSPLVEVEIHLDGVESISDVNKIKQIFYNLPEVEQVEVNLEKSTLKLSLNKKIGNDVIKLILEGNGFKYKGRGF